MAEPRALRLEDCCREALLAGEAVSAFELAHRFGGDVRRVEDFLASLARQGLATACIAHHRDHIPVVPFMVYTARSPRR